MKQEWQHKVLVFSFFLLLCLPLTKTLVDNKNEVLSSENRTSVAFPTFNSKSRSNPIRSIVQYVQAIKAYYADNFGFRNQLLSLFRFYKLSIFDVDPHNEMVVKGTDNWYFLGNYYNNVIQESKGITYFSESQLQIIETNIKTIYEDCKIHGIKVYIAIAPNKHSVYGQYLPIIKSEHPTKLEQLVIRMNQQQIPIIDLKEDFTSYPNFRLFYKNDTHWNSLGAFLGYHRLMDFIVQDFPRLRVLSVDDFKMDTLTTVTSDLTRMLSLEIPEESLIMEPKCVSNVQNANQELSIPADYNKTSNVYEVRFINNTQPLKVLVFRDSFFDEMIPFVKESFGESVFIWSLYERSLLDIEKPDLVIWEVVEREIENLSFVYDNRQLH